MRPPEPERPKPQFVIVLLDHGNAPFQTPKFKARVAQR